MSLSSEPSFFIAAIVFVEPRDERDTLISHDAVVAYVVGGLVRGQQRADQPLVGFGHRSTFSAVAYVGVRASSLHLLHVLIGGVVGGQLGVGQQSGNHLILHGAGHTGDLQPPQVVDVGDLDTVLDKHAHTRLAIPLAEVEGLFAFGIRGQAHGLPVLDCGQRARKRHWFELVGES